jgi:hypothetical protein
LGATFPLDDDIFLEGLPDQAGKGGKMAGNPHTAYTVKKTVQSKQFTRAHIMAQNKIKMLNQNII